MPAPAQQTGRRIKTAEEWMKEIATQERKTAKERREHQRHLEEQASCRDLRDQTIAHIKNARYSFQLIEDLGGPVVTTLLNWQEDRTHNPRITTMRRALRCIGKDLGIVDYTPASKKRRN